MKNRKQKLRMVLIRISAFLYIMANGSITVMASEVGANVVSNGLNNLLTIVTAIVSGIGALLTLWGVLEWGVAMSHNDGGTQAQAMKRISGGIVACLAPQLLPILISV